MPTIDRPHPGIESWVNPYGIRIVQLGYEADPIKGGGEKVYNERQKEWLSPWADAQERGMTDPSRFRQEYKIDFAATLGQRVFHFDESASFYKSFTIPEHWTRYMSLDPHERRPHAALWCAVDPSGDRWYYRELWPSEACGKSTEPPRGEIGPRIKDYVEAMQWLESAKNPDNCYDGQPFDEEIYKRVVDYSARSFGIGTSDDEPQENFQKRFEERANDIGWYLRFEDCKKDTNASVELVNEGLAPLRMLNPKTDEYDLKTSRIHVCEDACPELAWELRNNRWSELTPLQAENQDVSIKQIQKRKHGTDNMRYIESANPTYVEPRKKLRRWKPAVRGINF